MTDSRRNWFHRSGTRWPRPARCVASRLGAVDTPVFMPVGTAASVKAMILAIGKNRCANHFVNTYHLMLRPGADRIEKLGAYAN